MLDSTKTVGGEHTQQVESSRFTAWLRRRAPESVQAEGLTAVQMDHLRKRVIGAHPATAEIAEELTLALGLAQRVRAGRCPVDSAYQRITFVLDCLLSNPSKLVEARGERLQLQFDAYRHSGGLTWLLALLSAGNPTGVLIIALVASF